MTEKARFGEELDSMLRGQKPMAAFYKVTGEQFDETDGQPFAEHVATGTLARARFFIKNEGQDFTIMYTVFALPGEEWRMGLYKALKKEGQTHWSKAMGAIEEFLLNKISLSLDHSARYRLGEAAAPTEK